MRPARAPKRWLDDSMSATPLERDLLRAGLDDEPPPLAKAEVWAALVTQFPPPGGAPGAAAKAASAKAAAGAGGAGAAGAIGGGLLKSALIGAGSAVALIAAYSAIAPSKPEAPRPPPSAVIADAPRGIAPGGGIAPGAGGTAPRPIDSGKTSVPAPDVRADPPSPDAPPPAAVPSGSTTAPQASGASAEAPPRPGSFAADGAAAIGSEPPVAGDRQSQLLEESRRLTEARGILRSGDANGTIAALRDLDRQFPAGGLGQEREALMIEALAASGRRAEAKARAEAFLKAYPSSPHATRVQAYTK